MPSRVFQASPNPHKPDPQKSHFIYVITTRLFINAQIYYSKTSKRILTWHFEMPIRQITYRKQIMLSLICRSCADYMISGICSRRQSTGVL